MASKSQPLYTLKNELQNETDSSRFEKLVAALIRRLLNVPMPVANPGYQHGADAGPAGQHGRRIHVECKRYSDNTRLNERELLGEFNQALARNKALEAWILVTTREAPHQICESLDQCGERHGVPILILDWRDGEIGPLAALCASSPNLLGEYVTTAASNAARSVRLESGDAIESLKRNLESWCLGFESLRRMSHERLDKIWNNPRESVAVFGQDVSGGSTEKRVKRKSVHDALDHWWRGPARVDAPAVVVGLEGVGKTWATLNWLVETKREQPVILTIPSSAMVGNLGASDTDLKRFLAERLYALTDVRSPDHWHRRLDHILSRPGHEGPAITVWFDGLNKQPSVSWLNLLQISQAERFAGRIRVIVSTRQDHFEDSLYRLNGLVAPCVPIEVGRYDAEPGGELEQMLAYEDPRREDLRPDVLEKARTPGFFDLVVRLREQFGETGRITPHRILWEYGRETLGISFGEVDRRDWLKEIARQYHGGIREYSIRSLTETVKRPDVTEHVVSAHLSEIIDGRVVKASSSGDLDLEPAIVAHALAIELLKHLYRLTSSSLETLESELRLWLDPISGYDQTAEILRAAVSIVIEQGKGELPVAGVLLTAWLQAQNVTDAHRQEIVGLAPKLPGALLDVVENSDTHDHESARHWAVKSLRAIPRNDCEALEIIVERTRSWMGTVYRDIDGGRNRSAEQRMWRSDVLLNLIGADSAGPISVVGVPLNLVDRYPWFVKSTVPSILEGFPMRKALPTLEAAATALAAGDHSGCWDALKWLCLMNEVDPEETAEGLRDLSNKILCRIRESGVHSDLQKRVAALLLWLTVSEQDDKVAAELNPEIGRGFNYVRDYLSNPGRSMLTLERRHAPVVLQDSGLAVQSRVKRIGELWLDPTFEPSDDFVSELRGFAANIDVDKLDRTMGPTVNDLNFEETLPALARFAPDLLAKLMRRKLRSLETCPVDSRYWAAISATNQFILSGETEAAAARALRRKGLENDKANETFAASQLLVMEIRNLSGRKQFETLINADLPIILLDFAEVLRPLTPDDMDALIRRFEATSQKQQRDLLELLPLQQVELTDGAWTWVQRFVKHEDDHIAMLAFRILNSADSSRFGRQLLDDEWSWSVQRHHDINHYGTNSLIEASNSLSFFELAPKLAPWRLLETARRRGSIPAEVKLAAMMFDAALPRKSLDDLDPGSNLSIDLSRGGFLPFSYSVTPHRSQNEVEAMKVAFDPDANLQAHRRAIDTAASRIDEARRSGAVLFQAPLDKRDFEPVIQHAPDYIDRWLDGCSGPTAEFEKRVHLAEGAFLALCETLLSHDPCRGVRLWHALRETLITRYIGATGVDDLLHMVFRVPDSPEVTKLRGEIAELKHDRTDDLALFNIAIAATYNDKTKWLNEVLQKDRSLPYAWRQARATVWGGFCANNRLPIAEAWPGGELKTTNAFLKYRSGRSMWIEACARHWWKAYLKTPDPASAYAAWVLFVRAADRRIWTWMQQEIDSVSEKDDFYKHKMAHVRLNRDDLKRACKEREKELDRNFLYRKITEGIGPWT